MHRPNLTKIDASLWNRVVEGDADSFETVVVQFQGAVCAVAYNIIGDFSVSQDIAQDTFWAAWSAKDKLKESSKLRSWLCGIARNLAKQWKRKTGRRKEVGDHELVEHQSQVSADPIEQAISDEEESIVWKALDKLPENYREVVVLYYRQGKSIDEVAQTLELSKDAARQRLHRGREMLKSHVSTLVEGVLDRNNPTQSFTTRVMAGVLGTGLASQAATASASTTVGGQVAAAVSIANVLATSGAVLGSIGGLLGAAGGFFGAWLGTWLPAQLAPTETERQLLVERGGNVMKYMIWFALGVMAITLALVFKLIPVMYFVGCLVIFMLAHLTMVTITTIQSVILVSRLRKEVSPFEDPNLSSIAQKQRAQMENQSIVFRGRKYTSEFSFLGLPLIDIQVADPPSPDECKLAFEAGEKPPMPEPRVARGWIAIGDVAYGVLFAMGSRAYGGIAMGGIAVGLVAVGGFAAGILGIGGMGLGIFAIGGLAVGYSSVGGAAFAWYSATGGLAVAYHYALGGLAFGWNYAAGGLAMALEANTKMARDLAEQNALIGKEDVWYSWFVFPVVMGFSSLFHSILYRKENLLPLEDKFEELKDGKKRQ